MLVKIVTNSGNIHIHTHRNVDYPLETHPESLPGNCALQFRLAERQN
jgi:hypothetical protein